jgi:hypothetical protein
MLEVAMNYRRMLLGGLLAGVLICASELLLNGVVLADQMAAEMARTGLQYASWAMAAYVVMAFAYGQFLAWFYAAIRPRFGQGPRTAVIAAAGLWLMAYLLPSIGYLAMGAGPAGAFAIGLVWGAAELVLAALLAAYCYREA